jgi:hypothetical protein
MKPLPPRLSGWLTTAWTRFEDWNNVPIYRRGRLEVRRIDILIALGFVGCVSYYCIVSGWQGAMTGGLLYILMAMLGLWLL